MKNPYRETGVRAPGVFCSHCGREISFNEGVTRCGVCQIWEREEQLNQFMQKAMWVRT